MNLELIESRLDEMMARPILESDSGLAVKQRCEQLLVLAESVLETWVHSRGDEPTAETREGSRLLALHRQGVKGEPSFNACRETCREVAYHFNLLTQTTISGKERASGVLMMTMLVRHLNLFVTGKLVENGLGEFCCSSKPLRSAEAQ